MSTPAVSRAGLAPTRSVLDNGVVVLAKETRTTPAVTINLAINGGASADPPAAPGTMFLLSRVIDRGTATRPPAAIAEELDARGISLTVGVTRHQLSIVCTCLAEDFEPILALLAEMIIAPSFPAGEVATRKGEIVTAIRQDEDNPAVRAVEELMARLYPGGHAYGRRVKGSIEDVEALTREDLVRLHAQRFAGAALTAAVVGDVPAVRSIDAMGRLFGAWHAAAAPPIEIPAAAPARTRQRVVIPMMSKAQADVAYGFIGIRRSDPAYYACTLLNNAFGQYSIGGRLGDSIRERQGMAYYVYSSLDANVVEGPLMIRAGVGPANVDRAIASIDDEIARLLRGGITEKELTESRQYLIGSMPRALETNAGIAAFLQQVEFFGLGLDYDVRIPSLLQEVALDELHAAAVRLLDPARATIVVAGPYEER